VIWLLIAALEFDLNGFLIDSQDIELSVFLFHSELNMTMNRHHPTHKESPIMKKIHQSYSKQFFQQFWQSESESENEIDGTYSFCVCFHLF